MAQQKNIRKSKFREYTEAIIIAVILALLIRAVVVQAFKIPSGSMLETLQIGDHILVNKFIYGLKLPFSDSRLLIFSPPRRGDVIVFSFPGNKEIPECTSFSQNLSARVGNTIRHGNPFYLFKDDCRDFIKRVVGVGGDTIEIKNKKVYINNVPFDESYTIFKDDTTGSSPRDNFGPFTVPRKSLFVMGDNRDQSYDSRFWGIVDMSEIKGRAFIIYWSWNGAGGLLDKVRWDRLGKSIK